jgi:integrase
MHGMTTPTSLTKPGAGLPGPLRLRMQRLARASRAESTCRAYQSDWRIWEAWAATAGTTAMPASPEAVAAFLSDASATRKVSTLRRYVASISVAHQLKHQHFPSGAPPIRTILKGIAREKAGDRRRVRPLMARQVRAIMDSAGPQLMAMRDCAILALGVAMAARRSELSGLDWLTRGTGTGVLELTEHGAIVKLMRSKTSQAGDAVEVHIQPGPALKAVKDWVERAAIVPGSPLFRAVTRRGRVSAERIADRTIARIVKRTCDAAGLEAEHYSGHSLRSGMITSAAEKGIAEWRIRMTSRHSAKSQELAGYIRPVERRKHALTNDIGL